MEDYYHRAGYAASLFRWLAFAGVSPVLTTCMLAVSGYTSAHNSRQRECDRRSTEKF